MRHKWQQMWTKTWKSLKTKARKDSTNQSLSWESGFPICRRKTMQYDFITMKLREQKVYFCTRGNSGRLLANISAVKGQKTARQHTTPLQSLRVCFWPVQAHAPLKRSILFVKKHACLMQIPSLRRSALRKKTNYKSKQQQQRQLSLMSLYLLEAQRKGEVAHRFVHNPNRDWSTSLKVPL